MLSKEDCDIIVWQFFIFTVTIYGNISLFTEPNLAHNQSDWTVDSYFCSSFNLTGFSWRQKASITKFRLSRPHTLIIQHVHHSSQSSVTAELIRSEQPWTTVFSFLFGSFILSLLFSSPLYATSLWFSFSNLGLLWELLFWRWRSCE